MQRPTAATMNVSIVARAGRIALFAAIILGLSGIARVSPALAAGEALDTPVLTGAAPNGAPASPVAVIALDSPGRVTRSYARSALTLTSRLLDADGQPIAGAQVDVLQRVAGSTLTQVVGQAVSAADGVVVAHVPPGPSRSLLLAYRAYAGAPVYAAQTEVVERVLAGVRLRVGSRRARPDGRVVFDGRVLGVVPRRGVVVEVLVYYHGGWQPIRTPRTDSLGRFRVFYRFDRAYGIWPFEARVRDGQVGFPYSEASSRWVEVRT
jgi:hypothetical protein